MSWNITWNRALVPGSARAKASAQIEIALFSIGATGVNIAILRRVSIEI
jgi:hypothetical protein